MKKRQAVRRRPKGSPIVILKANHKKCGVCGNQVFKNKQWCQECKEWVCEKHFNTASDICINCCKIGANYGQSNSKV